MNNTLTTDTEIEPSPEEIARMRAELNEMYIEAEKTLARMDARQPEMDRVQAEIHTTLDSIERMLRR